MMASIASPSPTTARTATSTTGRRRSTQNSTPPERAPLDLRVPPDPQAPPDLQAPPASRASLDPWDRKESLALPASRAPLDPPARKVLSDLPDPSGRKACPVHKACLAYRAHKAPPDLRDRKALPARSRCSALTPARHCPPPARLA